MDDDVFPERRAPARPGTYPTTPFRPSQDENFMLWALPGKGDKPQVVVLRVRN